jgi:hypothetical protein
VREQATAITIAADRVMTRIRIVKV